MPFVLTVVAISSMVLKSAQGYKLLAFRMFTQDPNAVELDYDGFCVMMKKVYNLD